MGFIGEHRHFAEGLAFSQLGVIFIGFTQKPNHASFDKEQAGGQVAAAIDGFAGKVTSRGEGVGNYAALSLLDMENIMAFPRERVLFALWYLRAKRYVLQDDRSSFIISADGVDYLESQLPTNQILHKIFRASESGVMVYPKALTSKTT